MKEPKGGEEGSKVAIWRRGIADIEVTSVCSKDHERTGIEHEYKQLFLEISSKRK